MAKKVNQQRMQPHGKIVVLVAGIGFVAIVTRILKIAPQFLPYIVSVCILTLVTYVSLKVIGYVKAIKCPKCRRAMVNMGYDVVFNGATTESGDKEFPAIAIGIFQCPNCEDIRFYEFDYHILQISGDVSDIEYAYRVFDPEFWMKFYGHELPKGMKFPEIPTISEDEYLVLRERIQEGVRIHNEKAGF